MQQLPGKHLFGAPKSGRLQAPGKISGWCSRSWVRCSGLEYASAYSRLLLGCCPRRKCLRPAWGSLMQVFSAWAGWTTQRRSSTMGTSAETWLQSLSPEWLSHHRLCDRPNKWPTAGANSPQTRWTCGCHPAESPQSCKQEANVFQWSCDNVQHLYDVRYIGQQVMAYYLTVTSNYMNQSSIIGVILHITTYFWARSPVTFKVIIFNFKKVTGSLS